MPSAAVAAAAAAGATLASLRHAMLKSHDLHPNPYPPKALVTEESIFKDQLSPPCSQSLVALSQSFTHSFTKDITTPTVLAVH